MLLHAVSINDFNVFKYISTKYNIEISYLEIANFAENHKPVFIRRLLKDKFSNDLFKKNHPNEYQKFFNKYGKKDKIKRNIDNF